jgi:hypothetical protein
MDPDRPLKIQSISLLKQPFAQILNTAYHIFVEKFF